METAALLETVIAVLLVLLACCGVLWRLYVLHRDERDILQLRFDAMQEDRDGWRDVAQRALLVAQIGRNVSRRATRLGTRTGPE